MDIAPSTHAPRPSPQVREPDPLALDPDTRPGLAIKQAEQALMREKSRLLRALGLTVPQYAAMLTLSRFPELSGAQLARRCLVTPQSMASLLATLERRSLVRRTTSAVHAKVFPVHLTEAGAALLAEADQAAVTVERRLANAFTDAELDVLRSLLARATVALTGGTAEDVRHESEL
ncbi:MarR family transcriptional regulator [Frankia sp. Ag45/Mut15]|uniref:MarR family transcriptional regulator n=1 Tax=Frankia umida TaxID=573489 RepID=A0ABT0K280_9ACTN|nr:MarR family transcriptional regulator [Frankia umida]MCK9877398.1 MarR family transcriptional regulator [Frankia umida]